MHLSAQEINSSFLMLPETEQQKVMDFVLKKYLNKQLRLVPSRAAQPDPHAGQPRKLGLFKGQIKMAGDFNEPLPDSFWLEGKP